MNSISIPGIIDIQHYVDDTFKRSFTISSANVPVDLTGCEIKFIVSKAEGGNDFVLPITNDDLLNGKFSITYTSSGKWSRLTVYFYRMHVKFTDGTIRTYLKGNLTT